MQSDMLEGMFQESPTCLSLKEKTVFESEDPFKKKQTNLGVDEKNLSHPVQMSLLPVEPVGRKSFRLVRGATLDMHHQSMASRDAPQCLPKRCPKPVRSRGKAFSAALIKLATLQPVSCLQASDRTFFDKTKPCQSS